MTDIFSYVDGLLNTAADALSCPLAEEDAEKVCTNITVESRRHWDKKKSSSGSKRRPSDAGRYREVSINFRFFLVRKKGRAVETSVSI